MKLSNISFYLSPLHSFMSFLCSFGENVSKGKMETERVRETDEKKQKVEIDG